MIDRLKALWELIATKPDPYKAPVTLGGVLRWVWFEFITLPLARSWHRRFGQGEEPDLIERDRRIQMHLEMRDGRRPLTREQKKALRAILNGGDQNYPGS